MATLWVCALVGNHDLTDYLRQIRRQADVVEKALAMGLPAESEFDRHHVDIGIKGSPAELEPLIQWIHEESPYRGVGFTIYAQPDEFEAQEALCDRYVDTISYTEE